MMASEVDAEAPTGMPSILELLDLEYIEEDIYRSRAVFKDTNRLFGGQVAGQALYAAGRTVPDARMPHSLHGYFLRQGDALRPTVFRVERDRDGSSVSNRRVVAIQAGKVIFNLSASFAVAPPGPDDEEPGDAGPGGTVPGDAVPDLPSPDDFPGWVPSRFTSFEFRSDRREPMPSQFWVRCRVGLPDDPLLHAAVLAYTSDMSSGLVGMAPPGTYSGASMDHALWFHRPFRADGWIWQDLTGQTVAAGRGLYTGGIYSEDGIRIASTAQEALFMRHRARG
jgi:acyl-CoA thioesterase-2